MWDGKLVQDTFPFEWQNFDRFPICDHETFRSRLSSLSDAYYDVLRDLYGYKKSYEEIGAKWGVTVSGVAEYVRKIRASTGGGIVAGWKLSDAVYIHTQKMCLYGDSRIWGTVPSFENSLKESGYRLFGYGSWLLVAIFMERLHSENIAVIIGKTAQTVLNDMNDLRAYIRDTFSVDGYEITQISNSLVPQDCQKMAIWLNTGRYTLVHKLSYKGIALRSTWELRMARVLDRLNLSWRYEPEQIEYMHNGELHKYTPDFFVEEWDCYLDPHWMKRGNGNNEKYASIRKVLQKPLIVVNESLLEQYEVSC